MAAERLSMRQLKEILRQKLVLGRSHRRIARSVGVSAGSVGGAVCRATAAGLDWKQIEALDEAALETRLYGPPEGMASAIRPMPDPAYIHAERSRPGVTLALLHLEYLEKHPDGYRYTQFCEIYRRWAKRRRISMRQVHVAGEKLFVDFSGKKPSIVDPKTGEVIEVELFVAVLGASNYTYAEATRTQQVADWIGAHVRAFEYLEGVPRDVVPDQLKSGVTKACRYDPKIQRTYEELARHYETTVLPARPAHPKDKAKVEVGVQIAQRWILARLRHRTFFSLEELNAAITELVDDLNDRVMRTYRASRRELFERLDRPALRALPSERFVAQPRWLDSCNSVSGDPGAVQRTNRPRTMAAFRAYAVVTSDDRPAPRDDDGPPGGRVNFRGATRAGNGARGPFR
jgi:transposase